MKPDSILSLRRCPILYSNIKPACAAEGHRADSVELRTTAGRQEGPKSNGLKARVQTLPRDVRLKVDGNQGTRACLADAS